MSSIKCYTQSSRASNQAGLRITCAGNMWPICENIAHLAKYQPVFIERLRLIVETVEPQFERYDEEEDPEFATWSAIETNRLLEILDTDRRASLHFSKRWTIPM